MLVNQAWAHLETVYVHRHPKMCQFPHGRSNRRRRLPVQSTAAHIDGYLYSLLQHRCRWLLVQSTAGQKLFLPYRMKPSEYLYFHQQFNLQRTCIFCKFFHFIVVELTQKNLLLFPCNLLSTFMLYQTSISHF